MVTPNAVTRAHPQFLHQKLYHLAPPQNCANSHHCRCRMRWTLCHSSSSSRLRRRPSTHLQSAGTQPPTLSRTGNKHWVIAYWLRGECLVLLIRPSGRWMSATHEIRQTRLSKYESSLPAGDLWRIRVYWLSVVVAVAGRNCLWARCERKLQTCRWKCDAVCYRRLGESISRFNRLAVTWLFPANVQECHCYLWTLFHLAWFFENVAFAARITIILSSEF